ncbi:UNVERIFIED_CONTAM: hypothetical protein Slati_4469600 [Sesamum latifolium]|uniref:Reverse transcriptase RNase H-like domain-containing protein n=1 Tax=Sesamum latifolium TaxID=2727402 RepID=A0AAW2SRG3_9LAMI
MVFSLVVIARRLCLYFLSHPMVVRANLLLKQTLRKPDTSGRLVKWIVELREYDISYLPRTVIKAQALADFVFEMTSPSPCESPTRKYGCYIWIGRLPLREVGPGKFALLPRGRIWNSPSDLILKPEIMRPNMKAHNGMRMAYEVGLST